MKVLMISDVYFPRVNGVSTSIKTFRAALNQLGHEIWLIAPRYDYDHQSEDKLIRIESRIVIFDAEDRMMKLSKIMKCLPQLRQHNFDIVHIQTPFIAHKAGIKLAENLKIPVIETYHTYFEEYLFHYIRFIPKSMMRKFAREYTRKQCDQVDAVVVPSQAMFTVLDKYDVKTPISVIPTGINLGDFEEGSRERFCKRFNINSHRPILVHVGRVAHEKNISFLLQVTKKIQASYPDILLIIAGEGPARNKLARELEKLKIIQNVLFINYLNRGQELWDCYCAGNAFVFASTTETQGLVLLEAMALGVPVVSTAIMGTIDILDPEKGAIIANPDVEDFSDKVIELLGDDVMQDKLGLEGMEYAHEWSDKEMAVKLSELYLRIKSEHELFIDE